METKLPMAQCTEIGLEGCIASALKYVLTFNHCSNWSRRLLHKGIHSITSILVLTSFLDGNVWGIDPWQFQNPSPAREDAQLHVTKFETKKFASEKKELEQTTLNNR